MIFGRRDLRETDYYWNTNFLSSLLKPSAVFFNRFSGADIVRMINLFNTLVTNLSLREGQRVERMLVREMPLQVNDEISVFNWLKEHYKPDAKEDQHNMIS